MLLIDDTGGHRSFLANMVNFLIWMYTTSALWWVESVGSIYMTVKFTINGSKLEDVALIWVIIYRYFSFRCT